MKLENPSADDVPSPRPTRHQAASSGGSVAPARPAAGSVSPGSAAGGAGGGAKVSAKASAAAPRAGIRVDRAVSELRRGRPVRLSAGQEQILFAPVETMLPSSWTALAGSGDELSITLTAERAQASGFHQPAAVALVGGNGTLPVAAPPAAGIDAAAPAPLLPVSLRLPPDCDPAHLAEMAGLGSHGADGGSAAMMLAAQSNSPKAQTTPAMRAALELARLARLVPAIVTSSLPSAELNGTAVAGLQASAEGDPDYLAVAADDVLAYPHDRANSLLRVSEAPVPLAGHEDSRFVLFRETVADLEHVAIIVGSPDLSQPVLVRLHSSCLTGDLFASLRCDCGDQLRGAIDRLGEGGGILLYLAQEGRGIGLANKLRAYARQDAGLDTIDADRYLGFRGDERNFAVAVQMLRTLGIARIRLLTNNPSKIAALRAAGLDVVERLPIGGHVNRHNERYITTKRDRAGHLIDLSTLPAERHAG